MDFIVTSDDDLDLLKDLKKSPNEMMVVEEGIVVWLTELNQAIVILGDFRRLSDKDLNEVVREYVKFVYGVQLTWKLTAEKEAL